LRDAAGKVVVKEGDGLPDGPPVQARQDQRHHVRPDDDAVRAEETGKGRAGRSTKVEDQGTDASVQCLSPKNPVGPELTAASITQPRLVGHVASDDRIPTIASARIVAETSA
jgi:hypothetical protein